VKEPPRRAGQKGYEGCLRLQAPPSLGPKGGFTSGAAGPWPRDRMAVVLDVKPCQSRNAIESPKDWRIGAIAAAQATPASRRGQLDWELDRSG
jgi:hypothetical protein